MRGGSRWVTLGSGAACSQYDRGPHMQQWDSTGGPHYQTPEGNWVHMGRGGCSVCVCVCVIIKHMAYRYTKHSRLRMVRQTLRAPC